MTLESLNEFTTSLSAKQLLSAEEAAQVKGGSRFAAIDTDVWTDCQFSTPTYCGNNDDGEED